MSDADIYINPVPTPTVAVTHVDSLPSLNLGQSDDTDFLDKEVVQLRAIPLETTDDCLIGQISNLFLVGDTLVGVDGQKSKQIYLFNLAGKLLNTIGRVGNGPGEYSGISHANVNRNGIDIFDMQTNRFVAYDYSGNVIASTTFGEAAPVEIMCQNDSIFVGTYASHFEYFPFALQWLKGDSIADTALPYTIKRHDVAPSLFRLNDVAIGLHLPYVDTVYSITGRQVVPAFTFGLISEDESHEWQLKSAGMSSREIAEYLRYNKNSPANFVTVYSTQNYFVITHQKTGNVYISVVDRKTLQSRNYIIGSAESQRQYAPPHILSASGNTLIGSFESAYFEYVPDKTRNFIEKHFSEHDQELLKNHDFANNNPIVWLMDLK